MGNAARVSEVGDDEPGHAGKCLHRPGDILANRGIEVEDDRDEIPAAQFLPNGIQYRFTLRSEAAQNEDDLRSDGVNDITDFLIVKQQINELSDLKVVHRNNWLIFMSDYEVRLIFRCSL